jgi:TolB-like protein/tetratricopeptide (TPR) repeat protein
MCARAPVERDLQRPRGGVGEIARGRAMPPEHASADEQSDRVGGDGQGGADDDVVDAPEKLAGEQQHEHPHGLPLHARGHHERLAGDDEQRRGARPARDRGSDHRRDEAAARVPRRAGAQGKQRHRGLHRAEHVGQRRRGSTEQRIVRGEGDADRELDAQDARAGPEHRPCGPSDEPDDRGKRGQGGGIHGPCHLRLPLCGGGGGARHHRCAGAFRSLSPALKCSEAFAVARPWTARQAAGVPWISAAGPAKVGLRILRLLNRPALRAMSGEELRFGQFRFDPVRRQLTREGAPVRLGSRATDILSVLVSAHGEVVSKDELMSRVWPGQIVEENNLQVQMSALRRALGDGESGQSCLVTIPGRGYRLIALAESAPAPALPDKPSIAVLPFQNMSDDPLQDYFADGIVEDITTALSRMHWLFVIARNSSFAYKGGALDVKQVGRELGVRYVVEGSVRKAGPRVRITAQLIETATGGHLWADHFDGGLEDIFDLQDQVAASVVGAVSPRLEQAEIERARRKPTESLDAYDYYLRGVASAHRLSREGIGEAMRLLARAAELDPDFAAPHGLAAFCCVVRKMHGWTADRGEEMAEAERLAWQAAELGKDDAVALAFGGHALAYVAGDLENAAALIDRALALNPNLAAAWHASGIVRICRGDDPDLAIEDVARAMRLSPLDPFMFYMQTVTALAHFVAGRYADAAAWAERAVRESPRSLTSLRVAAASNALAGRLDEARKAMTRTLELDPGMRASNLGERIGPLSPADRVRYADALRIAGLPE